MIKAFAVENGRLRPVDDLLQHKDEVVWAGSVAVMNRAPFST